MTSAHQMLDVAGACSGMMDVFHVQRVCPVGNPCGWPNWVPPQRRACVYDAISFGRNLCRINVLSLPCLCTANSGITNNKFVRRSPFDELRATWSRTDKQMKMASFDEIRAETRSDTELARRVVWRTTYRVREDRARAT